MSEPLASLICPDCGKFNSCPQEQRGSVIACRRCKVLVLVPESKQGRATLAPGQVSKRKA